MVREHRVRGTSAFESSYQATASGACNGLRTLERERECVRVCVWGGSDLQSVVKSCVHKWSINPIPNPIPRRESL
jgi:hypothetical protein